MTAEEELKKIKKAYGEDFMKLCRSLFPTILEKEGLLYEILSSSFSRNSRTLYEDIMEAEAEDEFKSYIYSKIDVENDKKIIEEKTPYELLSDAGYDLFECTTEGEIQEFKKYYAPGEALCTFRGGRLNRCVVFFAIRKDVEQIKREDFKQPKRDDEYGTSVMGIQFERNGICTVSIKNRYNHTVNNPDATYGNDLERISPGLTQSFARLLEQRGLYLNNANASAFEIPNYIRISDGKYYKYNMEINGIYYCPGNIIIKDGQAHKLEPEKQILIDYHVLDIEKQTIKLYDPSLCDSFEDGLTNLRKIEIRKNKEKGNGIRTITIQREDQEQPIIIEINKDNQIIGYENQGITEIGDNFLAGNSALAQLNIPNVIQVGDCFLENNNSLVQLDLTNVTQVGNWFLGENGTLTQLYAPKLTRVGRRFLEENEALIRLDMPSLMLVGDGFLQSNRALTQLDAPKLIKVGESFLMANNVLTQLNVPSLIQAGDWFLEENETLTQLDAPNLIQVGISFLDKNGQLAQEVLQQIQKNKEKSLASNSRRNQGEEQKIGETKSEKPEGIVDTHSIARLDADNQITTTEISSAREMAERMKNMLREKEENKE